MTSKKNITLELFKFFASYMVVFIHVRFYGKLGAVMETLARFAVPFFFLVSGFFSYGITPEKFIKRIRHIGGLLLFSVVLYTLFNVTVLLCSGDLTGIVSYFSSYLSIIKLIQLFVFNVPVSALHLWYLYAILYVYITFYFVTKFRLKEKTIFLLATVLLVLRLIMGEGLSLLGIEAPESLVRNFVMVGIPFFCAGLFAKKYEDRLRRIPSSLVLLAVILGAAESLFFRFFVKQNEIYIGSLLILFAIVVTFIKHSDAKYPAPFHALADCSTYIYIFHILISQLTILLYDALPISSQLPILMTNLRPLIVCVCSTLLAYIAVALTKKRGHKNDYSKKEQSV